MDNSDCLWRGARDVPRARGVSQRVSIALLSLGGVQKIRVSGKIKIKIIW